MRARRSSGSASACLAACVALAGCAAARIETAPAPDLTPPPGAPVPPHAALYADCLAEAIAARRLELSADPSTQLLRFTCRGAPARAMFDALAAWSGPRGAEWRRDGRIWRSTTKVKRDLFGVDYCSAWDSGGDAACAVSLNAGDFLTAG